MRVPLLTLLVLLEAVAAYRYFGKTQHKAGISTAVTKQHRSFVCILERQPPDNYTTTASRGRYGPSTERVARVIRVLNRSHRLRKRCIRRGATCFQPRSTAKESLLF